MSTGEDRLRRLRREPPPLRPVEVAERAELSPRLLRLGFVGDGLRKLTVDQPAASVRLLVPTPGSDLELPTWNGNEFLLADGSRPVLRTFTPLRVDNDTGRLDLEIVRHSGGAVSGWAETAEPGDPAAVSGPGRGFDLPEGTTRLLVLGDETALPAIGQLVTWFASSIAVDVHVEVVDDSAVVELPEEVASVRRHVTGHDRPGDALVEIVRSLEDLADGTHLWAAGEASAMQAIRVRLFQELGLARPRATVRGYWKPAAR